MPIGIVLNTFVALVLAITSVVTVPIVSLGKYAFNALVFDTEHTDASPRWGKSVPLVRLAARLGFNVIGQAALSALGLVVHPAIAAVSVAGSAALAGVRTVYDNIMYYAVLKPFARIPVTDTKIARRIEGPGLSFSYYHQISSEQALSLLLLKLEQMELDSARARVAEKIHQPLGSYRSFCAKILRLVSWGASISHHALEKETQDLIDRLDHMYTSSTLSKITRKTAESLSRLHQVRQDPEALRSTLLDAEALVQSFVTDRLYAVMSDTERRELWSNRSLSEGDWPSLARCFLRERFSDMFLWPLHDGDNSVQLEVLHTADIKHFIGMLGKDRPRDDLDKVMVNIRERIHDLTAEVEAEMRRSIQAVTEASAQPQYPSSLMCDMPVGSSPHHSAMLPIQANWESSVVALTRLRQLRAIQNATTTAAETCNSPLGL
jgi:hypothetical protein